MLSTRRTTRPAIRRRAAIATLALLGQLAAAFGLPLPALSAHRKDTSTPYPCMNHPCGCLSAQECWRDCCCYSNAEKVAWAEVNGQTVPDFVREAAVREGVEAHRARCCRSGGHHESEPDVVCPACAAAHHDAPAHAEHDAPVRWVLGPAAARCHGSPAGLFQSDPAPPVSAPPAPKFMPICLGTLSLFDQSAISMSPPPLDPPPRA